MFEAAELGRSIDKDEYRARVPELRAQLLEAQFELRKTTTPVVIVISGADGAGKGDTVNRLHEWLDPRGLETHALEPPSDEERERPPYWRFWRLLPARGRMGIFLGSWYTAPIVRRVYGQLSKAELDQEMARVASFERMLVADGALVLKFWFHLAKDAQRARLEKLAKSKRTRWRVSSQDWKHFAMYDRFRRVSERALRATDTGEAPWVVVEAADDRYRDLTVGTHILDALHARIDASKAHAVPAPSTAATTAPPAPALSLGAAAALPPLSAEALTILDRVDLATTVTKEEYVRRLERLQARLAKLSRRAYADGRSSVIVFEGWDAAGKGGAIRRVTAAMDARLFQVISVAAPTDEERAHHYLWRFWRHIPRAGRVTVFDRSWYGRVLVERVEGFCKPPEWQRSYQEINEFEQQLAEVGAVVTKFWVHIDPDEQMRRFEARGQTPWKRHKITEEDWRNRGKWPLYEDAVNEMVARTSTADAPWVLVGGNDKNHARLKILDAVADRLEAAL